ncbi:hypothetical protein E4U46_001823 [Claviceps purpurea]|nr:hypothetical protein E4U46_001823 [Claviceps purpurea]
MGASIVVKTTGVIRVSGSIRINGSVKAGGNRRFSDPRYFCVSSEESVYATGATVSRKRMS